ncbi:MAG: DinB family protein [Fimbriimonadales bacterium]
MIERYRRWHEHERDANDKMIAMLESVPQEQQGDPRFARAVDYAAHIGGCRVNWLDRIEGREPTVDWFPENTPLESLGPLFEKSEARWLDPLSDDDLNRDFEYNARDGSRYRWYVVGQIVQLFGHAFYHRGMVAMIVDDLGGAKVDTDYLFWAFDQDERYGRID